MNRSPILYQQEGTVLVVTLLVIFALTGLTLCFSQESGVELNLASYSSDGFKAKEAASAYIDALAALLSEEDGKETLHQVFQGRWDEVMMERLPEIGTLGASVSMRVQDENGKLNLNLLLTADGQIREEKELQLRRLFVAMGIGDKAVDPLLDWLDADEIERMEGAERYYYANLDPPVEIANGPFLSIDQVYLVKGIMDIIPETDDKSRLADYLTIYSSGKININTASRFVLQCLSARMDETISEAIVSYREEIPFEKISDLKNVPGVDELLYNEIGGMITANEYIYNIELYAEFNQSNATVKTIFHIVSDAINYIYWKEIS